MFHYVVIIVYQFVQDVDMHLIILFVILDFQLLFLELFHFFVQELIQFHLLIVDEYKRNLFNIVF